MILLNQTEDTINLITSPLSKCKKCTSYINEKNENFNKRSQATSGNSLYTLHHLVMSQLIS